MKTNPLGARIARFFAVLLALYSDAQAAPVNLVNESPVSVVQIDPTTWLVDFGKVAFGNLQIEATGSLGRELTVHFGEAQKGGRIDRQPPGTVRYAKVSARLDRLASIVAPPADVRNTTPPAILTPAEWGVVLPFRWVEIEGWDGVLRPEQLRRRAAYDATWQDEAASFRSSDPLLNQVWELCRYSIKATTFAGVFVDGDRERIPYEADAYLNQLSYYACNPHVAMPRDTLDYLLRHPTWPTEWAPHLIFMAYADWQHTADKPWLESHFEALKPMLQLDRAGADGLLTSTAEQIRWGDIVDWPPAERDGFQFQTVNTVVNAFHLRALQLMAELATALGREDDARDYHSRFGTACDAFQKKLFDPSRGLYRDGIGTDHSSIHANFFPLAFDLVPAEKQPVLTEWLRIRGMACSVYGAQYLLEGLFGADASDAAIHLILAEGDRSWKHMVNSGTTITWEAWDQRYKPNQDWNHAWGAAPANLLPRFVLGVRLAEPGWSRVLIRPPQGEALSWCEGKIPTPRGQIEVRWTRAAGFNLLFTLPEGMVADIEIPVTADSEMVLVNSQAVEVSRRGNRWRLAAPLTGKNYISTSPRK